VLRHEYGRQLTAMVNAAYDRVNVNQSCEFACRQKEAFTCLRTSRAASGTATRFGAFDVTRCCPHSRIPQD